MDTNIDANLDNEYSQIITTLMMQSQDAGVLIELADEKTSAIRDNDTDKLLLIINEEEKLAQNMIALEKQRHFCIKEIEKKVGYNITNITSLIGSFSGDDAESIKQVASELRDKLGRLQSKNDINRTLLEVFLDEIDVLNNIITGEKAPVIYNNIKYKGYSGNTDVTTDDGLFDTKF